jgi:hypothetical protein
MAFNLQPLEPPALPVAKTAETPTDREQYSNVLRLFFNRLVYSINSIANTLVNIIAFVRPGVIESTATLYEVADSDENNIIRITNANPISVVLHLAAPIGFISHFHQGGAGQITISAEAGATVVSSRSLTTSAQYAALSAFKLSATEWSVVGDQE